MQNLTRTFWISSGIAIAIVAGGWMLARQSEADAKRSRRVEQTTNKPKSAKSPHTPRKELVAKVLERLHEDALRHFHSDPRFGMLRLPGVVTRIERRWELPHFSPSELEDQKPLAFRSELDKIHKGTVTDFLKRENPKDRIKKKIRRRFAFGRDRGKFDPKKKVWEAKSVDLIGLLAEKYPVAYTIERSRTKDGKSNSASKPKRRELDDFEFAALRELDKGKDLYARSHKGVVRMLGSIRAKKSCIACHEDRKEGDLFGAFSYTLREAKYVRRVSIRGKLVREDPLPFGSKKK